MSDLREYIYKLIEKINRRGVVIMARAKISIIGAGYVGSTIGYSLTFDGLVSELVLVDLDVERAEGEALDLTHSASFVKPIKIISGSLEHCQDSDIIIITAGVSQKPGETRLELMHNNLKIMKDILLKLKELCNDSVVLIVTNPVDILTHFSRQILDLPPEKIIGSGTVLDSSRFRAILGDKIGVDPRNVHGYVIGEHGDSEVLVWSSATIAGINASELLRNRDDSYDWKEEISKDVKEAAYKVISYKNATNYAVSLAVRRIVQCILRNENSVLPVSVPCTGQHEIYDISLSLPAIVSREGITKVLTMPLDKDEKKQLHSSAGRLKEVIRKINLAEL